MLACGNSAIFKPPEGRPCSKTRGFLSLARARFSFPWKFIARPGTYEMVKCSRYAFRNTSAHAKYLSGFATLEMTLLAFLQRLDVLFECSCVFAFRFQFALQLLDLRH